jgi:Mrp family chromosome partitioning ATPase
MTLIDRALTKAYSQRSTATDTAEEPPRSVPPKRGWVAKLRPPARETGSLRQPLETLQPEAASLLPAAPAHPATEQDLPPVRSAEPAARPIVRVDAKHAYPAREFAIAPPPAAGWAWPPICEQLLSSVAGPGIRGLASLLREMLAERGQRSLALTGPGRGAGRTSLALTIAGLLSSDPALRLLLVDLDFAGPSLGPMLGLEPPVDLWQVARGEVSAASALLTLVSGQMSALTLRDRVRLAEVTPERAAVIRDLLRRLRNEFDLVLIDLGPWEPETSPVIAADSAIETCVSVHRPTESGVPADFCECYRQAGIDVLGIVETFGRPLSQSEPHFSR